MGLPVVVHSGETGAPQITNAAGSLDAALNALLNTGFRVQTPTSIVVSSGVATVTLAGHGYPNRRLINVQGATPAGLNGDKFITVTGSGAFTFPAPGVPDGAATGSITVRRASCGWTRPHTAGGVSIYKRSDITATDMALWIDDTAAGAAHPTYARARMVWDYTDISTWQQQAPLDAQLSGGVFWPRGANSSTPKDWIFIGDSKRFYLFVAGVNYPPASYSGALTGPLFFGDVLPYHPVDAHRALLVGAPSSSNLDEVAQGIGVTFNLGISGTSYAWWARPVSQIGKPVTGGALGPSTQAMGNTGPMFPSPAGNGLILEQPVMVFETSSAARHPIRGALPGVANPLASLAGGELHLQEIDNVVGSTAIWLLVCFQRSGSYGHMAFKISEAWD